MLSISSPSSSAAPAPKLPRSVPQVEDPNATIFAFPPNREILGGTAYWIQNTHDSQAQGNILIDCPAWNETVEAWVNDRGGLRWLLLTHRGGIGKVRDIQAATGCEIVIQEQEAYLLPNLTVTRFYDRLQITPETEVIWTSGHSPGSACVYSQVADGILFTGRHLLPDRQGNPAPLRISKTFHWKRQLRNVQALRDRFTAETLRWIAPGASTGYLRGATAIDQAYDRLQAIDLVSLEAIEPGL